MSVADGDIQNGAVSPRTIRGPEGWRNVGDPGQPPFTPLPCFAGTSFCYYHDYIVKEPGQARIGFYKDQIGNVRLRGAACLWSYLISQSPDQGGQVLEPDPYDEAAFQLPDGYRPTSLLALPMDELGSDGSPAELDINTYGVVVRRLAATNCVNLDGITFSTN